MNSFHVGPGVKVMVDCKMLDIESVEMKMWSEPVYLNLLPGQHQDMYIAGAPEQVIEVKTKVNDYWPSTNYDPVENIKEYIKKYPHDYKATAKMVVSQTTWDKLKESEKKANPLLSIGGPSAAQPLTYYEGLRGAMLEACKSEFKEWDESNTFRHVLSGTCWNGQEIFELRQYLTKEQVINAKDLIAKDLIATQSARNQIENEVCTNIGTQFSEYLSASKSVPEQSEGTAKPLPEIEIAADASESDAPIKQADFIPKDKVPGNTIQNGGEKDKFLPGD